MNNSKYYLTIGKAGDLKNKKEYFIYRVFEIIPGLLSWLTIIILIVLSYLKPIFVAIFIIAFDIYWLIKTIYLTIHLRVAYKKTIENVTIDWLEKLKKIKPEGKTMNINWQDIYHLIILPVYQESYEIVKNTFEALVKDNYPKNKLIIILGVEERAEKETCEMAKKIESEYQNKFFKFLITKHPDNLPGEIRGKGSNINFAGKRAKEIIIDPLKIPYENIIVSTFDIDTRIEKGYFACLTYNFLTSVKPLNSSYQPIPLFTNNIWEAPSFSKIVAFSATFWHTIQQERPERLTTFSSHSMPFKALVDIDFWQKNVVSEDSRIFWQLYLYYNGDWRVKPLYFWVKMDANIAHSTSQTFINLYKQQRRWGYGAENIPYFLFGFLKNKQISKFKKIYYSFNVIEGFHSWSTNSLIIFLFGWLPLIFGGANFKSTLISYNLPIITEIVMKFAMIGMITSAVLTMYLLPPKPKKYGKHIYIWIALQWLLLPLTIIIFGSLPAFEAQTRLMFKKYLGFWVTPKGR